MESHYTRNLDTVMEWMADDVMWIGPVHGQYAYGKDAIRRIFKKQNKMLFAISPTLFMKLYMAMRIPVWTSAGRLNPRTAEDSDCF